MLIEAVSLELDSFSFPLPLETSLPINYKEVAGGYRYATLKNALEEKAYIINKYKM